MKEVNSIKPVKTLKYLNLLNLNMALSAKKTLNNTLQEKYPHLQVSVFNFKKITPHLIFGSEFNSNARENALQTLNLNSNKTISDYFDLKNTTVSKIKEPVYIYDLTHSLGNFMCDTELSNENLGSNKKEVFAGDFVISRLRSYLQEMAVIQPKDFRQLLSTEYLVYRAKTDLLSTNTLMVFALTKEVQTILNHSQYGTEHPRFYEFVFDEMPIPNVLLELNNEIDSMMKRAYQILETSKSLYKEAENLLYEALGLDSPSLRELQSNSWQSISCNDKGKTHPLAPSAWQGESVESPRAREGEQTLCRPDFLLCRPDTPTCHTEALAEVSKNAFCHTERSEVSNTNADLVDSSVAPLPQNDNVDCHADKSARNDNTKADSKAEVFARDFVGCEVGSEGVCLSQMTEADNAHSHKSTAKTTPFLEKYPHLNISIRPLSQSYGISGRLDSEYYQEKYDKIEQTIKKFETIKLKDLVDYPISSGATPKAGGDDYTNSSEGIPFLRAVDLKLSQVETTNFIYIKPKIHNTILKRTKLKSGDVLFSIAGTIGRCAIFDYDFEANINQALSILRFTENKGILRLYLITFFNSQIGQIYLEKYSRQGLQTNLNLEEVGNLEIPKIDTPSQKAIANKITQSFALRQESKNLLNTAKAKVEQAIENNANNL